MTHNNDVQVGICSRPSSAHSTVVVSQHIQPKHGHAADLQHVGTHQTTDAFLAGTAVAEDQELGHNRKEEKSALQAYADGLAAILHGTASPATAEVGDDWVRVDHGLSVGAMETKKEKHSSPWSAFNTRTDKSSHSEQA